MPPTDRSRFFSIHVMKTGGTTLWAAIQASFAPSEIYPLPVEERARVARLAGEEDSALPLGEKSSIELLREMPPEQRDAFRIFHVHQPAYARDLVGPDVISLTILRDPVERTISALRELGRRFGLEDDLERIYDDSVVRDRLLVNHHVRVFGLGPDEDDVWQADREVMLFWMPDGLVDAPPHWKETVPMDESRLERAVAAAGSVDLVGFLDEFDEFVDRLVTEYGWQPPDTPPLNVGRRGGAVDDDLRQRIEHDNALDLAFYDRVRALQGRRGKVSEPG